jgi:regulator of sigma E protease
MNYLLMCGVISALILVHELGHFIAARITGIPIACFSIGFGPKVFCLKTRRTEYRLSAIPCGGYVLPACDEESFDRFPLIRRLMFCLGGPAANILGAIVCATVLSVASNGASLETVFVRPFQYTWEASQSFLALLPALVSRPDSLSGIVGIVVEGGKYAGLDPIRLLEIAFLLSLNLAVFNLLPILPLDGGKIAMALSAMAYKPAKRMELPLAATGWALLLCLIAYVTIMDLARIASSSVT